jgi:hypothetical protein
MWLAEAIEPREAMRSARRRNRGCISAGSAAISSATISSRILPHQDTHPDYLIFEILEIAKKLPAVGDPFRPQ